MVTESNMNADEVKRSLFQESDINIFDIFAILYSYCEPRFHTIRPKLAQNEIYRRVSLNVRELQDSVLPRPRNSLAPIDMKARRLISSSLYPNNNQDYFDLQCFTLLHAIDKNYDNMSARSSNLSNFPTMPQHLNLNTEFALVYTKKPSQIYQIIQKKISYCSRTRQKCGRLRTGRDVGHHLIAHVNNLACLSLPTGYYIDFNGLDSSTRLTFPEDLTECRIALVPLIDQSSCLETQFFDLDSENKRPFLCTGLAEADRVAAQALHLLRQLSEKRVTIAIFPELCVPQMVRSAICDGLQKNLFSNVKMVVAGSLHEELDGKWHNSAYVLGPDGQVLWRQQKFQPYTIMRYQAKRLSSFAEFADHDIYENITTAPRVLVVRDTPLGRMAILLCSDLLSTDPHRKMLFDLGVNCIVVPAMSAVLTPDFTIAAEQFAIHSQATILLSNACTVVRENASCKDTAETKVSFAFLPAHPSIWWCHCQIPPGECPSRKCSENFILQLGSWPSSDFE
ncbi:hypothetical protein ES703_13085 [subsurface metagenome]